MPKLFASVSFFVAGHPPPGAMPFRLYELQESRDVNPSSSPILDVQRANRLKVDEQQPTVARYSFCLFFFRMYGQKGKGLDLEYYFQKTKEFVY